MDRGISFYDDIENKDTLIMSEYPNFVDPPKRNLPFSYRIVSDLATKVVLAQCYNTNEEVMTIAYTIEQNKDMYLIDGDYSIGGGNHFIELTSIDKIYNQDLADQLSIDKKKAYLLIHSGSRALGESIYRRYASLDGIKEGTEQFDSKSEAKRS